MRWDRVATKGKKMIKRIISWFVTDRYIEGRGDGWSACEDMLFRRAEDHGPEAIELVRELLT
jgi:hypothetical protein